MDHEHDLALPSARWQDGVLVSDEFDDVYFSREGGVAETRHVFLAGNDLPSAWRGRPRFTIGETGFGTGLNFLTTWRAWRDDAHRCRRLHYLSVEAHPLSRDVLARVPFEDPSMVADLSRRYPARSPGFHRVEFEGGRVVLTLLFGPVETVLRDVVLPTGIDAWYLDGFAPSRNRAMWTDTVFEWIATCSADDATLATYTSAGFVRRGLDAVGFATEKCAGFGKKREMTRGRRKAPRGARSDEAQLAPWHRLPPTGEVNSAVVIGGGLAGTAAARSLAIRRIEVTLVERAADLASGASGNATGMFHPDLQLASSPRERFLGGANSYLVSRLRASDGGSIRSERCGALYPSIDEDRRLRYERIRAARSPAPEFARWYDREAASRCAGHPIPSDLSLFYPDAGWVAPRDLCRANASEPGIVSRCDSEVVGVHRAGDSWSVVDGSGRAVATGDVLVIAAASDADRFPLLEWLPLRRLRGQVTSAAATEESSRLRTVIYSGGYVIPAVDGRHTIGATFDTKSTDLALRIEDHRANLERLVDHFPRIGQTLDLDPKHAEGRAAIRSATPDHLPIVGPMPEATAFRAAFDGLRYGRDVDPTTAVPWLPGLFVSVGHGSRGIISTQLSGELLASQIVGDPLPVEASVGHALAPARFLVRSLTRREC